MVFDMDTFNKSQIVDLKKSATSLTVDWLERSLYYVQSENEDSCVFKLDLNYRGVGKTKKVFCVAGKISKVEVSPYTRKLYWVEKSKLMVCNTDGTNRREFFKKGRSKRSCNCPVGAIEDTYTLDHSTESKPMLIFVDSSSQNIVSADRDGCLCDVVANNSVGVTLPLERIKSDFGTLYWTSQGSLYALKKNETNAVAKKANVHDVVIFGPHVQPFPPKECLKPKQNREFRVKLKRRTSNSLTLRMPEVRHACEHTSMPTVEYRIYYKQHDDSTSCDLGCNVSVTFEKEYTLQNLKPFTNYQVALAVSNYYMDDEQVVVGPSVAFQTAVGGIFKKKFYSI